MYTLEGVSNFANSILLLKSLNKTETPNLPSVVRSLFPKIIFLTFITLKDSVIPGHKKKPFSFNLSINSYDTAVVSCFR